jgi:hypothetical protein
METWLVLKDLSDYLQLSQNKIRYLMKQKQIPYYDNHGFLRFNRHEIDEWMKASDSGKKEDMNQILDETKEFIYRGRPIKRYALTANKILTGKAPWNRLHDFIRSYVERVNEIKIHDNGRDYLQRKEFAIFSNNFNDYLRVCCQLGLIEKRKGIGKEKEYCPTEYALRIYSAGNTEESKRIILESVLDIVKKNMETIPDERHSILLLWFILSLKDRGIEPAEKHFIRDNSELKNYFPLIRFNFSKSLCQFLFDNNRDREQKYLNEWNRLMTNSKKGIKRKEVKDRLPLFDE